MTSMFKNNKLIILVFSVFLAIAAIAMLKGVSEDNSRDQDIQQEFEHFSPYEDNLMNEEGVKLQFVEPQDIPEETTTNQNTLSILEQKWLERVIEAEAGAEDELTQTMCAEVILRRIRSDEFPNTLEGVLMERNQFETVAEDGTVITGSGDYLRVVTDSDVSASCISAVSTALAGSNLTEENILYFRDDGYGNTVFSDTW